MPGSGSLGLLTQPQHGRVDCARGAVSEELTPECRTFARLPGRKVLTCGSGFGELFASVDHQGVGFGRLVRDVLRFLTRPSESACSRPAPEPAGIAPGLGCRPHPLPRSQERCPVIRCLADQRRDDLCSDLLGVCFRCRDD